MTLEMHESEPAIGLADLEILEQALEVKLPEDYQSFLLEHNGGAPSPDAFRYTDGQGELQIGTLERFLSVNEGESENVLETWLALQGQLPENAVPIARDVTGNFLILGVEGEERGQVYYRDEELYWAWEDEHVGQRPGDEALLLVCETFEDFIVSLFEVEASSS